MAKLRKAKGYWKDKRNQRSFLEELGLKLNIKDPKEWGKVRYVDFLKHGAYGILNRYSNSSLNMLKGAFPEIKWKMEWFQSYYWNEKKNQREFLIRFAKIKGIKDPKDWGKVTFQELNSVKGGSNACRPYNSSPSKLIRTVLSEIPWKDEWFKRKAQKYWKNMDNVQTFLEKLAKDMNIKQHSDWGKVTSKHFQERKATSLLQQFGSSIYKLLLHVYPDIEWKLEWFPNINHYPAGHWKLRENRKAFLEEFASQNNIKKPRDWGKVTTVMLKTRRSASSLLSFTGGSLFKLLQVTYPEIKWEVSWFRQVPMTYWEDIDNRKSFLDQIKDKYGIYNSSDWKRVTLSLINSHRGRGLLSKYDFSLVKVIESVYPREVGSEDNFSMSEKQYQLKKVVKSIYHEEIIQYNYRHPGIEWIFVFNKQKGLPSLSGAGKVELDIFIPRLNIAFEYHGNQHYREHYSVSLEEQKQRDEHRRKMCEKHGIVLIEVPYWWSGERESLMASLFQSRAMLPNSFEIGKKKLVDAGQMFGQSKYL